MTGVIRKVDTLTGVRLAIDPANGHTTQKFGRENQSISCQKGQHVCPAAENQKNVQYFKSPLLLTHCIEMEGFPQVGAIAEQEDDIIFMRQE